MPDYSKTAIYKIQHEDDESLVYIGSTTDFTKRKCHHKYRFNIPTDKKIQFKSISDDATEWWLGLF